MKVYYSSSIRNKGKGLRGWPQRVNWEFEYAGTKRYISIIYRFPKGIVFDVITILDETKLQEFFEKYKDIEETLTPLQQRCAEQEHPYQAMPISDIRINKKKMEDGCSTSSSMSIPWIQQSNELTLVQKAYLSILKDAACFACTRFCVPYPPADSKFQKLLRFLYMDRVSGLRLQTYPVKQFFPLDIHFEMLVDQKEKHLYFNHPVTGIEHTLYFQSAESMNLPIGSGQKHNFYIMQSMYEIEPALPQGDTLQFHSSIQYAETSDSKYEPTSAASIGIIGGADGPTAMFISSKGKAETVPCGFHGLPLHSCYSVPSFKKEENSHFILEGINTKGRDSKEYNFHWKKLI